VYRDTDIEVLAPASVNLVVLSCLVQGHGHSGPRYADPPPVLGRWQLVYAAKGRELTQLHNGVARGNGLILYAQLFTSVCFSQI